MARDDEVDQVDHGTTSPLRGYVQLYAISSAISSATVELFSVEDDTICAQIRMLYTFFFARTRLRGTPKKAWPKKWTTKISREAERHQREREVFTEIVDWWTWVASSPVMSYPTLSLSCPLDPGGNSARWGNVRSRLFQPNGPRHMPAAQGRRMRKMFNMLRNRSVKKNVFGLFIMKIWTKIKIWNARTGWSRRAVNGQLYLAEISRWCSREWTPQSCSISEGTQHIGYMPLNTAILDRVYPIPWNRLIIYTSLAISLLLSVKIWNFSNWSNNE